MRPCSFAVLLTVLLLPATLPAQSGVVGLSGFTLGVPGGELRATSRCTPSQAEATSERCLVNDSVTVWLSRDTIVGVTLVPWVPRRYSAVPQDVVQQWWDRELRAFAERLFGPADTVQPLGRGSLPSAQISVISEGRPWDLLHDGFGFVANWMQRREAGWEARVAVGKLYFLKSRQMDVVTRAEVTLACAGRLFERTAPDSAGILRPVAPLGPTASCPRAPSN